MTRILLIDDDPSLQLAIKTVLEEEGYTFLGALDGKEGLALLEKEHPDLLLLDVMLPKTNGYDICRTLREQGERLPVIFLSAKGDIVDKGIGFKAGGDDYMVKPFDNSELLMRIEAHLRRYQDNLSFARAHAQDGSAQIGELEILFGNYEVRKNGKVLNLTSKEFELVALLASNPGKVFTRQQLFEHIWQEDGSVDTNSITVAIRRIREKLEDNASKPKYLLTVWGVGYKFASHI